MQFFITLFEQNAYIVWPDLGGWLGLVFLAALAVWLTWQWRKWQQPLSASQWSLVVALMAFAVLASVFLGVRLPASGALPPPGILSAPEGAALLLLAAIPWYLGAGFLGPLAAGLAGLVSGTVFAAFESHNPFSILEHFLLAQLIGVALQQNYRSLFYRLLRRPLFAGVMAAAVYPILFIVNTLFWTKADFALELDYALSNVWAATFAIGGSIFIAALLAEGFAIVGAAYWGNKAPLVPSPAERSIETRSFSIMGAVILLIVGIVTALGWRVATQSASNLIRERMEDAAGLAAENIPFILEMGQAIITGIALDETLVAPDPSRLETHLQQSPFFESLVVISPDGVVTASAQYQPNNSFGPQELAAIELANQGVPFQYYPVSINKTNTAALIAFVASMPDGSTLIGYSDLGSNPFTQPVIESLNTLEDIDGSGILIDQNHTILYHPDPARILTALDQNQAGPGPFFDEMGAGGSRNLVYLQPASGRSWDVVILVHAQQVQQQALDIALPFLSLLVLLSVILMVLLRVILRLVTGSLRNLAIEANQIAQDQTRLSTPLRVTGVDEVGQMQQAFELMRRSLRARLDEQEQLLLVSHGAASSLEILQAMKPVMQASLSTGASYASVTFAPGVVPELSETAPTVFDAGISRGEYAYLNQQLLDLCMGGNRISMDNPANDPRLKLNDSPDQPMAILAIPLKHETVYYGVLWVAYNRPHNFVNDEIRFFVTIGAQTVLVVTNVRLFMNSELGRQRLEAILASTPDPVLVTDYQNRLLLSNPVAWEVFGAQLETEMGKPIDELIKQSEIIEILQSSLDEQETREIELPNGRTYVAKATAVTAEGNRVGRVCVLRDVTRFKELDAMKSDFVSTVSHDLRSPLTLMHGYATMFQIMGDLNDNQKEYLRKIVIGVESMTRLVNNLLDLGKIEAGLELNREMVTVPDMLDHIIDSLQIQAEQKNMRLTHHYPEKGGLPILEVDSSLIDQALHNLVENAVKYTPEDGQVHVYVSVPDGEDAVLFEVKDDGIGIAPEDQVRLFEKFYRAASRDSRKQRGTGLGLAIVKSIAERHGGRVWVESELGVGSSFYFWLPARQKAGI